MRKITSDIVHAFIDGKSLSVGNSSTDGKQLFLFGNLIAWKGEDRNGAEGVFLTLAGWNTSTTRDRLSSVLRVMGHNYREGVCGALNVYNRKGAPFIGENTDHNGAKLLYANETVFVVHPCSAKGMDAVSAA